MANCEGACKKLYYNKILPKSIRWEVRDAQGKDKWQTLNRISQGTIESEVRTHLEDLAKNGKETKSCDNPKDCLCDCPKPTWTKDELKQEADDSLDKSTTLNVPGGPFTLHITFKGVGPKEVTGNCKEKSGKKK